MKIEVKEIKLGDKLSKEDLIPFEERFFKSMTERKRMETLNINKLKEAAVKEALVKTQGCVTYASELLGITRASVYKLAKDYQINIDEMRPAKIAK